MTVNKPLLTVLVAGTIATGGAVTQIDQPINANYADTGTQLVTYIKGNEIAVFKDAPRVVLTKWSGQTALDISVGNSNTPSVPVGSTAEITNDIGNGQTLKMQPTQDGEGFNIDIELATKPDTNVFIYQLAGWENMDFFYQAPLWQEDGLKTPTLDCTDTDCKTSDGATLQRPDNVVGSYVVYSKNKKDHIAGETNYETGKLFNIYRPLVTASDGSTTWATLAYADGQLTVTVPPVFLDNAKYPVVIDPTFGYTTIGGTLLTSGSNLGVIYDVGNAPSDAGVVTSFSLYGKSGGSACIYSSTLYDSANPNNLKDYTAEQNVLVSTAAWYTANSTNSFTLVSGTDYFIGGDMDASPCSTNETFYWDSTGAVASYRNTTYSAPPPSTFTRTTNDGARNYSMYLTYTAAAAASSPKQQVIIVN